MEKKASNPNSFFASVKKIFLNTSLAWAFSKGGVKRTKPRLTLLQAVRFVGGVGVSFNLLTTIARIELKYKLRKSAA